MNLQNLKNIVVFVIRASGEKSTILPLHPLIQLAACLDSYLILWLGSYLLHPQVALRKKKEPGLRSLVCFYTQLLPLGSLQHRSGTDLHEPFT